MVDGALGSDRDRGRVLSLALAAAAVGLSIAAGAARADFTEFPAGSTPNSGPIRLFDANVYATAPGLARCSAAKLVAPRPLAVMVTQNGARACATLVIRGSKLSITLAARSAIRRAVLSAGKRLRARIRRREARRLTLTVRTPAHARGRLTINATIGNDPYSAIVPEPLITNGSK